MSDENEPQGWTSYEDPYEMQARELVKGMASPFERALIYAILSVNKQLRSIDRQLFQLDHADLIDSGGIIRITKWKSKHGVEIWKAELKAGDNSSGIEGSKRDVLSWVRDRSVAQYLVLDDEGEWATWEPTDEDPA